MEPKKSTILQIEPYREGNRCQMCFLRPAQQKVTRADGVRVVCPSCLKVLQKA